MCTYVLTGISTGVFELRGDGSFHEWTIFNQHPAGAAKIQLLDDMFMGLRTEISIQENETESMALVLQTHPTNDQLPGVKGLEYQGTVVFPSFWSYLLVAWDLFLCLNRLMVGIECM